MLGVEVPRNYFEFSPSRIAKTARVKRNLRHHLRRETMKSMYFETLRLYSREKRIKMSENVNSCLKFVYEFIFNHSQVKSIFYLFFFVEQKTPSLKSL